MQRIALSLDRLKLDANSDLREKSRSPLEMRVLIHRFERRLFNRRLQIIVAVSGRTVWWTPELAVDRVLASPAELRRGDSHGANCPASVVAAPKRL